MNAAQLRDALSVLESVVIDRLGEHLEASGRRAPPLESYGFDTTQFSDLSGERELTAEEHVLVLLALAPHVRPEFFERAIGRYLPEGGELPEFGGVRGEAHRGVLPTGETAQFVLAGDDLAARLAVQRLLTEHWLTTRHVLWLAAVREGEPVMSGRLILEPEIVERITTGGASLPRYSTEFPAERVETLMDWDDLVLCADTMRQIREIEHWMEFNAVLLDDWGMGKRVKPGYRALFYGPPGTGKTLTAGLLGKHTGRPVFRIDLSRVVSKYIGETEKNLARLFDRAEHKDWILFFDEADALFGKRTEIRDAHDKYANQEVAYLLQRIEAYAGLVILATNQRGNVDEAFLRRFQATVHFPLPKPEERHAIWLQAFPSQIVVAEDIDWREVSGRFELTGAGIVSVAHFCALEALADSSLRVDRRALEGAILRELVKDGKAV
ncbi:MAG TPA: ATP-binding protein [Microthrixaceae bacterium]|nr:ATP-binding protein [Microthrixaceae bacterium]